MFLACSIAFIASVAANALSTENSCPAYENVNVFIGSGGLGFGYGSVNPGAQVPYGALRLGPDTAAYAPDITFRHFSGYNYVDPNIKAFSHTHLVGAGVVDLGNFGIMPFRSGFPDKYTDLLEVDEMTGVEDAGLDDHGDHEHRNVTIVTRGWWSRFDKQTSERASPGRYSVALDGPQVQVDLVALSGFAGAHFYEWKEAGGPLTTEGIVFDACHSAGNSLPTNDACKNASITVDWNRNTITSSIYYAKSLSGGGVAMYLHANLFDANPIPGESALDDNASILFCTHYKCADGGVRVSRQDASEDGKYTITSDSGTLFGIIPVAKAKNPRGSTKVQLQVGLSFISEEMASLNLQAALRRIAPAASTTALDAYSASVRTLWCSSLSSVLTLDEVIPGDDNITTMLYSAAYRSMMSPTVYSEEGSGEGHAPGDYLGADRVVHNMVQEFGEQANEFTEIVLAPGDYGYGPHATSFFSDLSLWDTYRTQHPWILLTQPDVAVGIVRSMQQITLQQGSFPRWMLASTESGCMLGESGMAAVVEALNSGLGGVINASAVYSVFLPQQTTEGAPMGRGDLAHYMTYGYVPDPSSTLTYAFDDYLLAQLADYVGDSTNADAAMLRSKNYANIWSVSRQFMCPRDASTTSTAEGQGDGLLQCPKSPIGPKAWDEYREGDALHWSWFVPHDAQGLIDLFSEPRPKPWDLSGEGMGESLKEDTDRVEQTALVKRTVIAKAMQRIEEAQLMNLVRTLPYFNALESFFAHHMKSQDRVESALPDPYYWAGNEHDSFAAWMFSFGELGKRRFKLPVHRGELDASEVVIGGYCTRTQYWSRFVTHLHYSAMPNGDPGNEDYGAMSTWLLFASLGIFPQAGTTNYVLGSPRIVDATVHLDAHAGVSMGHDNMDTAGSRFVRITTVNNSVDNVYVEHLFVNGKEHRSPFIDRSVLTAVGGCTLEFHMTATPVSGLCDFL